MKISVSNKSLFLGGLALKIFFAFFCFSIPLQQWFKPFLDMFLNTGFNNPYELAIGHGMKDSFPYPSAMLYILTPFAMLSKLFEDSPQVSAVMFKTPLLLADIGIFFILKSWLSKLQERKLIYLYWFSPVIIYINYMHTQLDVIPIFLLLLSVFFMIKERENYSAIALALALATKTSVVIVLPFIFSYLVLTQYPLKQIFLYFLLIVVVFLLVNSLYILDPSFISMVFANTSQSKALEAYLPLGDYKFYLVPACLILLFLKSLLIKSYNKDIFIMFLGFSFSVILLFTLPMPGWYYWIIPFFSYFYAKNSTRAVFLFIALQFSYILFFLINVKSDYLNLLTYLYPNLPLLGSVYVLLEKMHLNTDLMMQVSFTFMQTILLLNTVWIYRRGLKSYSKHKITSSSFMIGLGGDSGVGKTSLSDALQCIFSQKKMTILRGDDMHKWQRGDNNWKNFTHLDPKANHLHKEVSMLSRLKKGRSVDRRSYDHSNGMFTEEKVIKPANIILFEGLHPFYLSAQRALYDLKIFIKPEHSLAKHWKISRDIKKRNYTKETIIEQIENRVGDSEKYILQQSKFADILIEPCPMSDIAVLGEDSYFNILYKVTLPNAVFFEIFFDYLSQVKGMVIEHNYNDVETQSIVFSSEHLNEIDLTPVTRYLEEKMQDIGINNVKWPVGGIGVLTCIIVHYIFEVADYD